TVWPRRRSWARRALHPDTRTASIVAATVARRPRGRLSSRVWPGLLFRQCLAALLVRGVRQDRVRGTHGHALRLVVEADTLRASPRVDQVGQLAFADRFVRAVDLAGATAGAVFRDHRCHAITS